MNVDELLEKCKELGPWKEHGQGTTYIRNEKGECPICAVANSIAKRRYENLDFLLAARRIGLDADAAKKVVYAADTAITSYETLRKKIEALIVDEDTD